MSSPTAPAEPTPGRPSPLRRGLTALHWHTRVAGVEGQLELLRERLQRRADRSLLAAARAGRDVCWLSDDPEPLVTIRIATFNRADALMERALPAALAQTYERIEVLVVGDGTDAATDRAMAGVRDPRVRYLNLGHRGQYPSDPARRWMVSGGVPMNVGIALARGEWIAPGDDDDEFTPDHVEAMLRRAHETRAELVHSRMACLAPDGSTRYELGTPELTAGQVGNGCVLYSLGLRFMTYSLTCQRIPEPHDWNLFRRMRDIGVRTAYLDRVTYRYFATPQSTQADPLATA